MKNFAFILTCLLTCNMAVSAQPQWGNMPKTEPTYRNINYAGDNIEAHNLDIYL